MPNNRKPSGKTMELITLERMRSGFTEKVTFEGSSLSEEGAELEKFLAAEGQLTNTGKEDSSRRVQTRFPSPDGLRWEDIVISVFSHEAVEIVAKGVGRKRYTFAEMGFKDGRKGDVPDLKWACLLAFAKLGGQIDSKSKGINPSLQSKLKTYVKQLRSRLKAFFSIDADPFYPYKTVGGYRTRFELKDNRLGEGREKVSIGLQSDKDLEPTSAGLSTDYFDRTDGAKYSDGEYQASYDDNADDYDADDDDRHS